MTEVHPRLLHSEYFVEPFGDEPRGYLQQQVDREAEVRRTSLRTKPAGITVAVQIYDNDRAQLLQLMEDVESQDYQSAVQTIFLDATGEKSPEIAAVAAGKGAAYYPLDRKSHSLRADFLNAAVERADYDAIFTTIGHASLSNTALLARAAMYAKSSSAVAYGLALPGKNAS